MPQDSCRKDYFFVSHPSPFVSGASAHRRGPGHKLFAARIEGSDLLIIYCSLCGSFCTQKPRLLLEPCRRPKRSSERSKLMRGIVPGTDHRLGPSFPLVPLLLALSDPSAQGFNPQRIATDAQPTDVGDCSAASSSAGRQGPAATDQLQQAATPVLEEEVLSRPSSSLGAEEGAMRRSLRHLIEALREEEDSGPLVRNASPRGADSDSD